MSPEEEKRREFHPPEDHAASKRLVKTHPKQLVGVNDDPEGVTNDKKDDDGYE